MDSIWFIFIFFIFFPDFFFSPLRASSSCALPYTQTQPTLLLRELSVKELSARIVAQRFKRA